MKRSLLFSIVFISLFLIIGCSNDSSDTTENNSSDSNSADSNESAENTELNIALGTQPPTIDQHMTAEIHTRDVSRLIFETLLTVNSKYEIVPMLAESYETDDNQTYIFNLRKGVQFHNGKEMTAEDVIASMNRWVEKSDVTGVIFKNAVFEEIDDYTVELQLSQPSALALDTIASTRQSAAIMPKEVIDEAGPDGVIQYVGTGPYKFVEWKPDDYIHLEKYDEYEPVEREADGLSGKKEALVDDIYFRIVPDTSTRLAGLQTGQYDIAYALPYNDYELMKEDPNIDIYRDAHGGHTLMYNKSEGPVADFKMRQAINYALNIEEIMVAAFAHEDNYWLDSGYMDKHVVNWASDKGKEYYNVNDIDKAKQILDEIGYDGEEITLMTSRDEEILYNSAIVVQDQLKSIGLNVEIEVYDFPTLLGKTNEPDAWDIFVVGSSTVSTPSQLIMISPSFSGGVGDSKIIDLLGAIEVSETEEEAKELWDELQEHAWENHLPITMFGGYYDLFGATTKVEGFSTFSGGVFWNTKVAN